eukprot:EG_transcript_13181
MKKFSILHPSTNPSASQSSLLPQALTTIGIPSPHPPPLCLSPAPGLAVVQAPSNLPSGRALLCWRHGTYRDFYRWQATFRVRAPWRASAATPRPLSDPRPAVTVDGELRVSTAPTWCWARVVQRPQFPMTCLPRKACRFFLRPIVRRPVIQLDHM